MDQTDSVITNLDQIQRVNDDNLINRANKVATKDNVLANQSTHSTDLNGSQTTKTSKKPKNTALKQQRLPAWQPILTAKTVLPLFFTIGVIFVILGGILLHYSNIVNETVIDYTDCISNSTNSECSKIASFNKTCFCDISFKLDVDYEAPVYLYYGLKNFYQNHRRYVKSRDDNQLLGKKIDKVSDECKPYDKPNSSNLFYAPCGAIANSLFNDSFVVEYNGDASNYSSPIKLSLLDTGIAWNTDKRVKFKNPDSWENTVKPPNWQKNVYELSSNPDNNGYINEDLIVWMRTSALPSFRKFYRRVNHSMTLFSKSLPKGFYKVNIQYNYPVTSFSGRKTFVISTVSWIGGKNPFLGIAYLVVGSLCICLGFLFLVIHFKFARNTNPNQDLINNVNNINNNKNSNLTTTNNTNRNTISTLESIERN